MSYTVVIISDLLFAKIVDCRKVGVWVWVFGGIVMPFGYFNNRVFAISCHYTITLDTAKKCLFVSLHAEQTKFVSINAEFLSERSGN